MGGRNWASLDLQLLTLHTLCDPHTLTGPLGTSPTACCWLWAATTVLPLPKDVVSGPLLTSLEPLLCHLLAV